MKKKNTTQTHTSTKKKKRKEKRIAVSAPVRVLVNYRERRVFVFFACVFCPQTKAWMALCKLGGVKERRDAATLPWRRHRPLDDLSGLRPGRSQLKVDTGRVPYRIASPTTSSPEASWENRSRAPTDGRKWAWPAFFFPPLFFLDLGIQQRFLVVWESIQRLVGIKPSAGFGFLNFFYINIFIISMRWYAGQNARLKIFSLSFKATACLIFRLQSRKRFRALPVGRRPLPGMLPWERHERDDHTAAGESFMEALKIAWHPKYCIEICWGKNKTFFAGKNIFFCLIFNNKTSCLGHFQGLMTSCIAVPNEAETSEKKQKTGIVRILFVFQVFFIFKAFSIFIS